MKKDKYNNHEWAPYTFTKDAFYVKMCINPRIIDDPYTKCPFIERTLETELVNMQAGSKSIPYQLPRPTFFDWLFRRCKIVDVEVSGRDVLKEAPIFPGKTVRLYSYKIKTQLGE